MIRVDNRSGLVARFFAADQRVCAGVQKLTDRVGHRQDFLTAAYCPYKSGRTLRLKRLVFAPDGLSYGIEWRAADYKAEKQSFYLLWVIYGSRGRPGNPFPQRAQAEVLPAYRRDLRAVIRGGLARQARA